MDFEKKINAISDLFYDGFQNLNDKLLPKHPVEVAQNAIQQRRDETNFHILQHTQGLHAPLRLMMERKMCEGIGRLPFLPSSNLMRDVLDGTEDDLDFSAFFKDPMEQESFTPPNVFMERRMRSL